jgi:hypothetical protein
MAQSKAPVMTLEEAKGRFEEWRTIRRGKARIPACMLVLWQIGYPQISKVVLSFRSPHAALGTRMNAWAVRARIRQARVRGGPLTFMEVYQWVRSGLV